MCIVHLYITPCVILKFVFRKINEPTKSKCRPIRIDERRYSLISNKRRCMLIARHLIDFSNLLATLSDDIPNKCRFSIQSLRRVHNTFSKNQMASSIEEKNVIVAFDVFQNLDYLFTDIITTFVNHTYEGDKTVESVVLV